MRHSGGVHRCQQFSTQALATPGRLHIEMTHPACLSVGRVGVEIQPADPLPALVAQCQPQAFAGPVKAIPAIDPLIQQAPHKSEALGLACRQKRFVSGGQWALHAHDARQGPQLQTIAPVAISSSNRRSSVLPFSSKGSNRVVGAYFSTRAGFSRARLTWPMLQPAKRRSLISL